MDDVSDIKEKGGGKMRRLWGQGRYLMIGP